MTFYIFHCSFGNPQSNWFPWLKKELEKLDQKVYVPQFPVDDWDNITKSSKTNQNLESWVRTFQDSYTFLDTEPMCFIGHSVSSVFILHLVDKMELKLNSAIFVAPFLRKLNKSWQIDLVNQTFYKEDFDYDFLKLHLGKTYSLFSDNDPYVDQKISKEFIEKIDSEKILVKGAGHFNEESGYSKILEVLDICKKIIME